MLPDLVQQLILQPTAFLSDFGEPGCNDYQGTDSGCGAVVHHGQQGFFGHGNDGEIDRLRKGLQRGEGVDPGDVGGMGIDRVTAAVKVIALKRIEQAVRDGWLKPCADQFEKPSGRLDPGEASAIARALEIDAGLLLDDRAAVVYARALGLKVIGTMGLLVLAKRRGLIEQVAPLIGQLQVGGHYLGPSAVRAALHAAGEAAN